MTQHPAGIVEIVDSADGINWHKGECVEIYRMGPLYDVLGLHDICWREWLDKYGLATENPSGRPIIPDFPIFSKVCWMHIDYVRLTLEELPALIDECKRAEGMAEDEMVRHLFCRIEELTVKAQNMRAELEFGHP